MFALTTGGLMGKILDCAAGPSSFNAELTAKGYEVTSCDPIYSLTAEEILTRILATRERMNQMLAVTKPQATAASGGLVS